jgi:uncharacterized protein Yka (UPF0111/DUF47 family)
VKPRHWFMPEVPDVLAMLRRQAAVTVEGMDALVAWTLGEAAGDRLRDCEHRADAHKRELSQALSVAFTTPLEPEELFELSRRLDDVLNQAKDTVREAELMLLAPDPAIAEMATCLAEGTRLVAAALSALSDHDGEASTTAADAAVKRQRHLEHIYRRAMTALLDVDDLREVTARRELYRRLARTSDALVEVAERVWHSVLKRG